MEGVALSANEIIEFRTLPFETWDSATVGIIELRTLPLDIKGRAILEIIVKFRNSVTCFNRFRTGVAGVFVKNVYLPST